MLGTSVRNICEGLSCSDPSTPGQFLPTLTLEGTTCGWGKVCHLGSCVTMGTTTASHVTVLTDEAGKEELNYVY